MVVYDCSLTALTPEFFAGIREIHLRGHLRRDLYSHFKADINIFDVFTQSLKEARRGSTYSKGYLDRKQSFRCFAAHGMDLAKLFSQDFQADRIFFVT